MMSVIAHDLAKHLDQRVEQAVTDYIERCTSMGCHPDEVRALAIKVLGEHLTALAIAVEATEPEFVSMCRWYFHNAQQAIADG